MVKRKGQVVYVIQGAHGIDCFTNLAKLIRTYNNLTYHPIYNALKNNGEVIKMEYQINKLILK